MKKIFLLTYTWTDSEGLDHYEHRWYLHKIVLRKTIAQMERYLNNFKVMEVLEIKDYKKIKL